MAFEWSPAVILFSKSSTSLLVKLPQPLTNSCRLKHTHTQKIPSNNRVQCNSVIMLIHGSDLNTREHTGPRSRLHKLSTACPSPLEAGQDRRSCSEGSECCTRCSRTSLKQNNRTNSLERISLQWQSHAKKDQRFWLWFLIILHDLITDFCSILETVMWFTTLQII